MARAMRAETRTLRGTWSASVRGRTLSGTWTAEAYEDPEAAWGEWEMLGPSGVVLLRGSWAARKVKTGWSGRWRAKPERGAVYEGDWQASVPIPDSGSFFDLLEAATEKPVGGSWRADSGLSGTWSVRTGGVR